MFPPCSFLFVHLCEYLCVDLSYTSSLSPSLPFPPYVYNTYATSFPLSLSLSLSLPLSLSVTPSLSLPLSLSSSLTPSLSLFLSFSLSLHFSLSLSHSLSLSICLCFTLLNLRKMMYRKINNTIN